MFFGEHLSTLLEECWHTLNTLHAKQSEATGLKIVVDAVSCSIALEVLILCLGLCWYQNYYFTDAAITTVNICFSLKMPPQLYRQPSPVMLLRALFRMLFSIGQSSLVSQLNYHCTQMYQKLLTYLFTIIYFH